MQNLANGVIFSFYRLHFCILLLNPTKVNMLRESVTTWSLFRIDKTSPIEHNNENSNLNETFSFYIVYCGYILIV